MAKGKGTDRATIDLRASLELKRVTDEDVAEADDDDLGDSDDRTEAATAEPTEHQPRTPRPTDAVHGLPTQSIPRKARPGSSNVSLTRYSTTTSPVEAMKLDEIARTRVFLKVALATCFAGIVVAIVSNGDALARDAVVAGSLVSAAGAAWMLWRTRNPATYSTAKMVPPALAIVVGSMAGVYYWGVASPVAALLLYGIYFFGLAADARATFAMYLLIAVTHGVLGGLVILGVIEDRGVVAMSRLKTLDQLNVLGIVEFLYLIAYVTARKSQRVTLDAMSKLEQAVRGVANREALLAEARAELDRALKVGGPGRFTEQVVGSFRLGTLIGRGGMGEVYEAFGVADQREAAVKLLHPGTLGDPISVARFIREAQTSAKLDCPNVVRVLEVGTTAGEVPFLAMERLRGYDLAHQLRRQRKLALPQARALGDQLAIGLEAARVAGIVHRDLKPHNVFFSELGDERTWKILDFGVSKQGGSGTLTKGHVVGTPAYMAPEQARGEDVDHRADVYSLAAILYRSLTGHPAFTGKDVPTTLYEVVYRVPTQPSMLVELPADIDRLLAIGLAKDPKDRFATALELAAWLDAIVDRGLDAEQRKRADELIQRHPWGTRLS